MSLPDTVFVQHQMALQAQRHYDASERYNNYLHASGLYVEGELRRRHREHEEKRKQVYEKLGKAMAATRGET